ncbi:MAG: SRPBCC family protein [Saprospiraceae bacterium]|nr:SRPBCC family protein [Saprospiraceae bacterium]
MKMYAKEWQQIVPAEMSEVWDFFSRPENLNRITPEDMNFQILTNLEGLKMYPGILVQYVVRPLPFMKSNWITEITAMNEHRYFIDEQRFGPFKFWHHQHHFKKVAEGVLMTDLLHYAIPIGFLGRLAHTILVNKRIDDIFTYRKKIIEDIFTR